MRLGKLDNDELERLVLKKFQKTRSESLQAPQVGEDCAWLDLGGDLAVFSCDPITSASIAHLGRLSVHVNCNDAAAAGAEPVGLLVTLLAPPSITREQIGRIADDLAAAARDAGVDIVGGHTEVTDAVTRPVTNTAVVARCPRARRMRGLQAGDDVVMTKWAGLEGTAIIVEDFEKTEKVNELLHENREYIVGRLGIPFKDKNTAVISVVLRASAEVINALSGKLGMIAGIKSKVLFK